MIRVWNSNLAARFIVLLLLALVVSQLLTLSISWDERGNALREVAKTEFLSRSRSLALLLDTTPSSLRSEIVKVSNTTYAKFWIHKSGPSRPSDWWRFARGHLLEPMADGSLGEENEINARAELMDLPPSEIEASAAWTVPLPNTWPTDRPASFIYLARLNVMGIATPLKDGSWLHAVYAKQVDESPFDRRAIFSCCVTALALCAIAILLAREISRPLQELASAAERLGRGEAIAELVESGPDDVRRTAQAFNRMQQRIHRFIEDRTRMLAAIGHDLRTPLTSLRLRTEFVTDPELQSKMLATIEEIRIMTEAAIGYARNESDKEETRAVDINALVGSLCDDLSELGMDIVFNGEGKTILYCRPAAVRRAIRNLIENAIRYGLKAQVQVKTENKDVVIEIIDEGEGIPIDEAERVFTPFYRLEVSRNRNTGGLGLGLATARSIVRQHGGDITMVNLEGGLLVKVSFPS